MQNYTSLDDRRANVSRSQGIFTFSVYSVFTLVVPYLVFQTTTESKVLRGKVDFLCFNIAALLRRVDKGVPALFRKIDINRSAGLQIHFFTSSRVKNLHILIPNNSRFKAIAYRRLQECTFGNIVLQLKLFHLSDKILLKCKRY